MELAREPLSLAVAPVSQWSRSGMTSHRGRALTSEV